MERRRFCSRRRDVWALQSASGVLAHLRPFVHRSHRHGACGGHVHARGERLRRRRHDDRTSRARTFDHLRRTHRRDGDRRAHRRVARRTFGWRSIFIGVAALTFVALTGLALTLKRIRADAAVSLAERIAIARRPDVLGTLAVTVITIAGAYTLYSYLAPFLQRTRI